MRHKWKKLRKAEKIVENTDNQFFTGLNIVRKITSTFECVNCGLKKGNCNEYSGIYPKLVYYRDGKVISLDKIPHSCIPILKKLNIDFITEEEFSI